MGLEFVWQDMIILVICDFCGDMKGFFFCLYVIDDFYFLDVKLILVLKVWNLYLYNLYKVIYEGFNNLYKLFEGLKWCENKCNYIIG